MRRRLSSLAASADGRIAISGSAMGTIVLAGTGDVVFARAFAGDVAFDKGGDLVITGTFAGQVDFGDGRSHVASGASDAFIAKLDRAGKPVFVHVIGDAELPIALAGSGRKIEQPSAQRGTAIAVGADDTIAAIGEFDLDINLFGENRAALEIASADVADHLHHGSYVVRLDPAGNLIDRVFGNHAAMKDVAIGPAGDAIITGASYADNHAPYRDAFLERAGGAAFVGFPTSTGTGHALAVDGCGNLVVTASLSTGGAGAELYSELIRIVP